MISNQITFQRQLCMAQEGDTDSMQELIDMYMPLINKHSYINGIFNEDLRQCIIMKFIDNLGKFKI